MTRDILGRKPRIGKRWPYQFLNFLPSRQLHRYLAWQSGGTAPDPPFQLGKALTDCKRILIVLPDDIRELLIVMPLVQAHFRGLPGTATWFMATPRETPFLAGVFGPDRILSTDPDHFFIGEPHFGEILRRVQGMRFDLILNFNLNPSLLLQFLLRASLAPLRVQFSTEPCLPFANITLRPSDPLNLLRNYLVAAQLWLVAERPVSTQWSRFYAPQEGISRADALLIAAGLKGENTVLFLWQNRSQTKQAELLRAAASKLAQDGGEKTLAVVHGGDPVFESPEPPEDIRKNFPCLHVESTGALLGLFTQTSRVLGTNGPLLHLACLSVADVEGFFETGDAPFDTSFLNKHLRVFYLDKKKEEKEEKEETEEEPRQEEAA